MSQYSKKSDKHSRWAITLCKLRKKTSNARIQRKLDNKIASLDGGYAYSMLIRQLYNEIYGTTIGYGTYGGIWTLHPGKNIKVGNYCSFASDVNIFIGNHPIGDFTTHPIAFAPWLGAPFETCRVIETSLEIGNDVWVGQNAIILPSCNIVGDGAIIAAGAVVTKDVPPYAIVAGNPAKILRYRLTPEQIEKVQASQWWLLDKESLSKQAEDLLLITNSK